MNRDNWKEKPLFIYGKFSVRRRNEGWNFLFNWRINYTYMFCLYYLKYVQGGDWKENWNVFSRTIFDHGREKRL